MVRPGNRVVLALTTWFVVTATAPESARAQTPTDERTVVARELFQEGMQFVRARAWSEAARCFQRAHDLRPTAHLAYNLASALAQLGELVQASELLRAVASDPLAPAGMRRAARTRLEGTESRIGRLSILVQGELGKRQVLVDERPMEPAMLGVPLPVDPGSHRVRVRRGMSVLISRTVSVDEGSTKEVRLDLPPELPTRPAFPSRAARAEPLRSEPVAEPDPGLHEKWWFWTTIGVTLVGAVATAVIVSQPDGRDPFDDSLGSMVGP